MTGDTWRDMNFDMIGWNSKLSVSSNVVIPNLIRSNITPS